MLFSLGTILANEVYLFNKAKNAFLYRNESGISYNDQPVSLFQIRPEINKKIGFTLIHPDLYFERSGREDMFLNGMDDGSNMFNTRNLSKQLIGFSRMGKYDKIINQAGQCLSAKLDKLGWETCESNDFELWKLINPEAFIFRWDKLFEFGKKLGENVAEKIANNIAKNPNNLLNGTNNNFNTLLNTYVNTFDNNRDEHDVADLVDALNRRKQNYALGNRIDLASLIL